MRYLLFLPAIALGALLVSVSTGSGQSSPSLRIVSPRPGSTVSGTVSVVVKAPEALEMSFLVFGIDQSRPVAMNTRPFVSAWDTRAYADGPHLLFVEAHGPAGLVATAGPIRVIVRNHAAVAGPQIPKGRVASRVLPFPRVFPVPAVPAVSMPGGRPDPVAVMSGRALSGRVRLLDGQAYLPVRPLVVEMGGIVGWDQETHSVTIWYGDREVLLVIGSAIGRLDGAPVKLSTPPTLDAGRTILGARTCGQLLNLSVAWDAVRRLVLLGWMGDQPKRAAGEDLSAG